MKNRWHTDQHYVIVNDGTGVWVQQSFVPDARSVNVLNDHEVRCGRSPCYSEKYFSSDEIREHNERK